MHCHAIHPGAGALAPRTHHARLGSGVTGVSLSAGAASPRTGLWSTDVGSRRPSAQRRSTSVPCTQRSAGLRVQATPTASPHDVVLSAACVKYSKVWLGLVYFHFLGMHRDGCSNEVHRSSLLCKVIGTLLRGGGGGLLNPPTPPRLEGNR